MHGTYMPVNWQPQYPAWEPYWENKSESLVAGYFGIQAEQPQLLDEWASQSLFGEHAPLAVEQGLHVDGDRARDFVYLAYWRQSNYRRWWALADNSGWWGDDERLTEGVGYWREIISMPFDRFETLHLSKQLHGVSVSAQGLHGPIREHGYPGSIRDRIPISDSHSLRRVTGIQTPLPSRTTAAGNRVTVTPYQNTCAIRIGLDWSACGNKEKTFYRGRIFPRLLEGMKAIGDNPAETGCYSLRYVDEMDGAWGASEKGFVLGYSVDVHAYEGWANTHSTHRALLARYRELHDTFGADTGFALWHEVTALPKKGCEFEYIGCRPGTGLLGYT